MSRSNDPERTAIMITIAERRAAMLAREKPEITKQFESGQTIKEIARSVKEFLGLRSLNMACSAVNRALETLLDPDEKRSISLGHKDTSRISAYLEGTGIHSVPLEARQETARETAKKLFRTRKGIAGFSKEEQVLSGQMAAISRGLTPYEDDQKEYLRKLLEDPSLRYEGGGRRKGKPNFTKISQMMNERFGLNRSITAYQCKANELRHKKSNPR